MVAKSAQKNGNIGAFFNWFDIEQYRGVLVKVYFKQYRVYVSFLYVSTVLVGIVCRLIDGMGWHCVQVALRFGLALCAG